jgi:alkanesulfonate monooxygenase SsuD/methylene tetrahydromethanopterin reductase-like flavin-dependent oxidoreductase (luciferase family)
MHNVIDLPDLALTELADFGRRAEAEGYDAIVAADRPGSEPLVALAAVAAATERIGLVAALVMQPERSTALLARQAATLDVLSGGRLTVVLEVGHGAPAPPMRSPERLLEMHADALRAMWTGPVHIEEASLAVAA